MAGGLENIFGYGIFTSMGGAMGFIVYILIFLVIAGLIGFFVIKALLDKSQYKMDAVIFVKQANGYTTVGDKIKRVYDKKTGMDYYHLKKLKSDIKKVDFDYIQKNTIMPNPNLIYLEQISSDDFAPMKIEDGAFKPVIDPLMKRFLVERYSAHAKKFAIGDFFQQYQGIIGVIILVVILMIYSIFMGSAVELTKQTGDAMVSGYIKTVEKVDNLTDKISNLTDKIDYILRISETYNRTFQSNGTLLPISPVR